MGNKKPYHNTARRRKFYEETYEKVGGRCMICGEKERLVVDHDHITGEFRGLLCYSHNAGLGMFQDRPELLDRAAMYLREHQVFGGSITTDDKQKDLKHKITSDLINDLSFESDRARSKVLATKIDCSEMSAQARVVRMRRQMVSEGTLRAVEGPKNRPYNSRRINEMQKQKIEF